MRLREVQSISQACSQESMESPWIESMSLQKASWNLADLGCCGLQLLHDITLSHAAVQCDSIKQQLGRTCMLITAGEECHHFKRGEKEVRTKRFPLCLEGCEDGVLPPPPHHPADQWRVTHVQSKHLSWRLHVDVGFNATCQLNASSNQGAMWW